MKIARIELRIARQVKIDEIQPGVDHLYEDVKSGGKKIVSVARDIDREMIEKLQDYKIQKLWVKRPFYRWVSAREARSRNSGLLETKNVEIPVGKAILKLASIDKVGPLRVFLNRYRACDISPLYVPTLNKVEKKLKKLQPRVEKFIEKLITSKKSLKGKRVIKLLKKPPEQIAPIDFPSGFKNFASGYLDYLCDFHEQHFQLAEVVIKAGVKPAKNLIE
ncbi:MAG: hypothetical protein ACLFN5_06690 [bacterium]